MKRSKSEKWGAGMTDTAYSRLALKKEIRGRVQRPIDWSDFKFGRHSYLRIRRGFFKRIMKRFKKWVKDIFSKYRQTRRDLWRSAFKYKSENKRFLNRPMPQRFHRRTRM
jgi:hypothetical protein